MRQWNEGRNQMISDIINGGEEIWLTMCQTNLFCTLELYWMKGYGILHCALTFPRGNVLLGMERRNTKSPWRRNEKCFFTETYDCSLSYQKHCILLVPSWWRIGWCRNGEVVREVVFRTDGWRCSLLESEWCLKLSWKGQCCSINAQKCCPDQCSGKYQKYAENIRSLVNLIASGSP